MTDRKKPGVAFWATALLAGLVLYVASFGPACGLVQRKTLPPAILTSAYQPFVDAASPRAVLSPLLWEIAKFFGGRRALFDAVFSAR
jgi:hypothetical protein